MKRLPHSWRPIYWPPWVFVLIALITLLFLLWSGVILARMPDSGMIISDNGVVEEVYPNSPAAWMGMRKGDVILEVNGRPLAELESPYEDVHAGEWTMYTVARDSGVVMFSAPVERLPASRLFLAELPVILGAIFWSVSLFVLLLSPARAVSVVFFFLGQYATIMFSSGAVTIFTNASPERDLFTVSLLLTVPLMVHYYTIFPSPRWRRYRRVYLGVLYALALLFVGLYLLDVSSGFQNPWLHTLASLRTSYVVGGLAIALISLFAPRSGASMHSRRLQRLLIAGMLFSVLPVLAFSMTPDAVMGYPLLPYYLTMPFLALLPISYAYGVLVGRLHRFDRILKDAVATTAMILLYLAIYLLASAGLKAIDLYDPWAHAIPAAFVIFLVICSYAPWRRRVDVWLNRAFYGRWYDYRSLLQQHMHPLSGVIAQEELAQSLLSDVRSMRFVRAILFWAQDGVLRPYQFFGYSSDTLEPILLREDGPIAQRLKRISKLCATDNLWQAVESRTLPPESRWLFEEARIQIWMPLVTKQHDLLGILALGERQSGEPLDRDDWAILNMMADQTSLAAENIHLIETLQNQLEAMRQIQEELKEAKWRLAESRERERLELAQLLHDGPIQDIYSVIYHLAIWRKRHNQEDDLELDAVEKELMAVEKSLRMFSTELRPPSLDTFGIAGAIRSHLSRLREENLQVIIKSDLASISEMMTMEESLALFRIYQESVRNALRHGQPEHIWVRLFSTSERVVLEIEDDGRGFEPPERWVELARLGHFGLLGIAERAEAVGAHLDVISSPGKGALVRVSIPVAPPASAADADGQADGFPKMK